MAEEYKINFYPKPAPPKNPRVKSFDEIQRLLAQAPTWIFSLESKIVYSKSKGIAFLIVTRMILADNAMYSVYKHTKFPA